jgi:hypothetical protein
MTSWVPIHLHHLDHLFLELLLEDSLECDGIGSKLGDTFSQLLNTHDILVEVETEISFVVDICLLLNVQGSSIFSIQLLWDCICGVKELLKQIGLETMLIYIFTMVEVGNNVPRW